jgi:hypothetical protein
MVFGSQAAWPGILDDSLIYLSVELWSSKRWSICIENTLRAVWIALWKLKRKRAKIMKTITITIKSKDIKIISELPHVATGFILARIADKLMRPEGGDVKKGRKKK